MTRWDSLLASTERDEATGYGLYVFYPRDGSPNCLDRYEPERGALGYKCGRELGHDGPQVTYSTDPRVIAIWGTELTSEFLETCKIIGRLIR